MGFVLDVITDWIVVGLMERLRQRHPMLAWSLILVPLALLAGLLVWALLR